MKSSSLAEQIGARIRKLRLERQLTQEQLGERAGLDPAELSRYERGKRTPGLENLARIAEALGLPLPALVDASEEHEELSALVAELRGLPEQRRRAVVGVTRLVLRELG